MIWKTFPIWAPLHTEDVSDLLTPSYNNNNNNNTPMIRQTFLINNRQSSTGSVAQYWDERIVNEEEL